jgi:hypothetical protein
MNFNSQICTTREQSKRLLALGLKRETADMMYQNYRGHCIGYGYDKYPKCITDLNILRDVDIPAWSLHRLIEIAQLPQYWECISGNWYEEVVVTIQSKIHIGKLNKEYLEHLCGKY